VPRGTLDNFSLPDVRLRASVYGKFWENEIYASIAKFHHTKGFDTSSQEVAIKLGYPLVDVGRLNDLISGGKVCVPFLIIECKDN
jgi:hypothetical protein